jgi:hypothetical protein
MFVSKASCLYYKHAMIINYTSTIVSKLKALLTDDTRVVISYRHVFIVQATGAYPIEEPFRCSTLGWAPGLDYKQ